MVDAITVKSNMYIYIKMSLMEKSYVPNRACACQIGTLLALDNWASGLVQPCLLTHEIRCEIIFDSTI